MKSLIATICLLGLVGMVVGVAVKADNTVTATVTPQIISVTVSDGSVNYGILDAGETADTNTLSSEEQIILNGSNVSADIKVKSDDAKIGEDVDWQLGTPGTDIFGHQYDINDSASWTNFPSDNSYTALSVVTLNASGEANDDATLDLKILMPTTISDTSDHTITVTVLATEAGL